MDLQRLRSATAADHDRVEKLVPLVQPDVTADFYASVLSRFYGFIKGWEVWAETTLPQELLSLLRNRRRSSLLVEDLQFFGKSVPVCLFQPRLSTPVSVSSGLGAMYVIEGSTLGGQYIARHLEDTLHLQHGHGNAYFIGYGRETGAMWREFQESLKALPDTEEATVIGAAQNMFQAFGSWMQIPPSMDVPVGASEGQGTYA